MFYQKFNSFFFGFLELFHGGTIVLINRTLKTRDGFVLDPFAL